MITRITRGKLHPNAEARVFEILREATRGGVQPPGLLGMSISRQVVDGHVELVSVSIWQDVETMATIMGPNWREPAWLPGLAGVVADSRLELLETVVTSYRDLAETRLVREDVERVRIDSEPRSDSRSGRL
jgi:hypothetical protein